MTRVTTTQRPQSGPRILLALLAIATTLAYWNHFDNGFHFDDGHIIVDNVFVRDLTNVPLFFIDPETKSTLPTNRAYRPLLMVSFAADYALAGGYQPFWFHLTSFAMFLLQGVLMWGLFRTAFNSARPHPGNGWAAALAVGLYWLHTVNAETVNYITARSDILSTLFVLAAFAVELKARGRWRHCAWLLIVAGTLVKPTAVMYAPLLFVYRVLFERGAGLNALLHKEGRHAWRSEALRIVPGALIAALAFAFTHWMTPDTWTPGGHSVSQYLMTQPFVMLRYFGTFFLPLGLSADSDWTLVQSISDWRLLAGSGFLLICTAVIVRTSALPHWRPVAFGLTWFFVALAPSSSVIPLAEVTNDHRMYFPFVGLTMASVWAVALLLQRYEQRIVWSRGAMAAIALLVVTVLGAHAAGVHVRNEVWHDEASLWSDVAQKSPGNGRGLMNYGLTRMSAGDYAGALALFEQASLTSYSNHPYLLVNLGIAKKSLGRIEEAKHDFERALALGPGYSETHYYYGRFLWQQGDRAAARRSLERAVEIAPGHGPSRRWLDWVDEQLADAVAAAKATANAAPTPENQLNFSLVLFEAGRYEASAEAARAAIRLREDYAEAWNNLCSAHNALRRYTDAIAACERALAIAPGYQLARNNLAWAIAQQ